MSATQTQIQPLGLDTVNLTPFDNTESAFHATFRQRALIVNERGQYEVRDDFETPSRLADNEVKIRSCAVGLNQIDFKSVDYNFCLPSLPWITGREMAGVVEEVGSAVTELRRGQRVWTTTYYKDIRAGCFQSFVIVPQHTVTSMHSSMTFASAASMGVCGLTAAMTLWKWLAIPMPLTSVSCPVERRGCEDYKSPLMLVWGGSSVTGQFMIQLARLSGLRVISISSCKTRGLLESLGANYVIVRDGKTNAEIIQEVRGRFGDCITMAVDLVGAETAAAVLLCLSTTRQAWLAPVAMPLCVSAPGNVEVLLIEMKKFTLDPASRIYSDQLSHLVDVRKLKLPEIEVLPGGLHAVEAGLQKLKAGGRATKLVVDMTC